MFPNILISQKLLIYQKKFNTFSQKGNISEPPGQVFIILYPPLFCVRKNLTQGDQFRLSRSGKVNFHQSTQHHQNIMLMTIFFIAFSRIFISLNWFFLIHFLIHYVCIQVASVTLWLRIFNFPLNKMFLILQHDEIYKKHKILLFLPYATFYLFT